MTYAFFDVKPSVHFSEHYRKTSIFVMTRNECDLNSMQSNCEVKKLDIDLFPIPVDSEIRTRFQLGNDVSYVAIHPALEQIVLAKNSHILDEDKLRIEHYIRALRDTESTLDIKREECDITKNRLDTFMKLPWYKRVFRALFNIV